MSQSHINELHRALVHRGWQVNTESAPQGVATWDIQRGNTLLHLDFNLFGGMGEDIPLEECGGCKVRGHPVAHLYFRRINHSRELWATELAAFLASLDERRDSGLSFA